MSDQIQSEDFFINEITVQPYYRIMRIMGIILCTAIFIIAMILLGYRGRSKSSAILNTILESGQYTVPFLLSLWTLSGAAVVFLVRLKNTQQSQTIKIDKFAIKIHADDKVRIIKLKQTDKVVFRIMPLFQKLYDDRFHRIGQLVVIYKGKREVFYFPIRNDGVAFHLKRTYRGSPTK